MCPASRHLHGSGTPHGPALSAVASACQGVPFPGASFTRPEPYRLFSPGPVGSSFGRDSWFVGLLYRSPLKRLATISVPDGAAPLIALAERGPDPDINGRYFSRFNADGRENKQARDQAIIDGLWQRSAALVGLT